MAILNKIWSSDPLTSRPFYYFANFLIAVVIGIFSLFLSLHLVDTASLELDNFVSGLELGFAFCLTLVAHWILGHDITKILLIYWGIGLVAMTLGLSDLTRFWQPRISHEGGAFIAWIVLGGWLHILLIVSFSILINYRRRHIV